MKEFNYHPIQGTAKVIFLCKVRIVLDPVNDPMSVSLSAFFRDINKAKLLYKKRIIEGEQELSF